VGALGIVDTDREVVRLRAWLPAFFDEPEYGDGLA
jgi:hypothetical protein